MNTVTAESKGLHKVSGSRFDCVILPVSSKEEVDIKRNEFKAEHASATHICYAYRLAKPRTDFSTDAGEPKGTAGKPLLNLLLKHQLIDTAIIVARYYGGKKLGVQGLIEAYSRAGESALQNAALIEFIPLKNLEIQVPFNLINEVFILAKKHKVRVNVIKNEDPALLRLTLEESLFESFAKELKSNHLLHSS